MNWHLIYLCVTLTSIATNAEANLQDYFTGIGQYFGYKTADENSELTYTEEFMQTIPYELATNDEKFITEAAKLTGVALSELDSCQQRVVFKLQSDCNQMNDEQLAKMAVQLLNCQSYVEGRQIFPCTDEMSIRDCTKTMDSDTWTSYHLMSNRARAVCFTIRQSQFRGLAEHTVNRLMEAARDQLKSLLKIQDNQESLRSIAEDTYETLDKGQRHLADQQRDLQSAQFHGQLAIEDNINRIVEEKKLIAESHRQLVEMSDNIQNKLANSAKQLADQNQESKINHKELIDDILKIQLKTQEIFAKITASSKLLIEQNEELRVQYKATLEKLAEVNKTVHGLVKLVGNTKQALEERLSWITELLGGTDKALDKMYALAWHVGFVLVAMLACGFLGANFITRIFVVFAPAINLSIALCRNYDECLGPFELLLIIMTPVIVSALRGIRFPIKEAITNNEQMQAISNSPRVTPERSVYDATLNNTGYQMSEIIEEEQPSNYESLTPPASRLGHFEYPTRSRSNTPHINLNNSLKGRCSARTRTGAKCRISVAYGRDVCFRHNTGDSIIGDRLDLDS